MHEAFAQTSVSGNDPGTKPNLPFMKTKPVLKSPGALFHEVLGPEPAKPAEGNSRPSPTDAKTQREDYLHINVSEDSRFAGYRHWGLNE
jgi:hypothetical protein